jgi:hypothetical protein
MVRQRYFAATSFWTWALIEAVAALFAVSQRQRFLARAYDGYRDRWGTFVLRGVSDGTLKGTY